MILFMKIIYRKTKTATLLASKVAVIIGFIISKVSCFAEIIF